jgi:hypothetical protein
VASHQVLSYNQERDAGRLIATIEGYPAWCVDVQVLLTDSGPAVSDLSVYPYQGAWNEADGRVAHPESGRRWSGFAADVPPAGLPTRALRRVNVGELRMLASQQAGELRVRALAGKKRLPRKSPLASHFDDVAASSGRLAGESKRPGRRGNGIDHYLTWAIRYADKVQAGRLYPVSELAREYGESATYVRDTITDARRRYQLLSAKPGRGRAGGELTEKALELRAERQDQEGKQ